MTSASASASASASSTTNTIELYNKLYDKNIRELNLRWYPMINIRPEIKQFENLQTLDLSRNRIINICPEIGQLQKLYTLFLHENDIVNICPEIGQLLNLRELYLSYNLIISVCPEIGQLKNLRELYLSYNRIISVCPEIGQLKNLLKLNLSYNRMIRVCLEMGQLKTLQMLFLNDNQITIIPTNIIQCNNLVRFDYHDNNIEYYIPCVQRFLDRINRINRINRIRNNGGTIVNIYNDGQNVHTSSIQTSIKNSIFNLLNTRYKINEVNNYIEDSVLAIKTKELITEYISLKETHSNLDCTFEEIFKAVWNEILTLNVDFQDEVKKRLNEEMDDSECKCFTGRISRLVNCLSGYSDKVSIQISDAEQIGNIISLVRSKYNDSHNDSHNDSNIHTVRQIVRDELTERKFDINIIDEWISYIN